MTNSAYDVYQFYLEPSDLREQSHTVKIQTAMKSEVFDPKLKKKVPRIVLAFENKKKVMVLNKTQCGSLIDIAGTDDFEKWAGIEVIITPAPSRNNRQTIAITTKAPTPVIT
jgi:hypothetical protein